MVRYPLGRLTALEELAASAAYLASDDSGYVTASVLPVHGAIPAAFTIPGGDGVLGAPLTDPAGLRRRNRGSPGAEG